MSSDPSPNAPQGSSHGASGAAGIRRPPGVLVVIEGIDGAGTTTQTRLLADALRADGVSVHTTREPSDGPIGLLLREILAGRHAPVDATTLALLYAADRADHLQREVEPALAAGQVVISDRYYHSSLAYQGAGEDRAWIRELNRRARRPDLTVLVQVDPEVAATRRAADGRTEEIFDDLDTQRAVAAGYRDVVAMLADEPIEVVDGHAGADEVAARIAALARETCARAGLAARSGP